MDTRQQNRTETEVEGFTNNPHLEFETREPTNFKERGQRWMRLSRERSRRALTGAHRHATSNPWLDIGATALTFFALGYVLAIRKSYRRTGATKEAFEASQKTTDKMADERIEQTAADELTMTHSY